MITSTDIVIEEAAKLAGVTPAYFLIDRERSQPRAFIRQCAMALLRERGISYQDVARAVGRADHNTAIHAETHVNAAISLDSWESVLYYNLAASVEMREGLNYEWEMENL